MTRISRSKCERGGGETRNAAKPIVLPRAICGRIDGRRKSISAMTDGDLLTAFIVGSREGPFTHDVRIEWGGG